MTLKIILPMVIVTIGLSTQPCLAGPVIINLLQGKTGGATPTLSPGDAFNFDYRSITSGQLPLNLAAVKVTFSSSANPTSVKLLLSTGDLLSVGMLSSTTTIFEWYNPAYIDPAQLSSILHAEMPQAWWNELSGDGMINARLWIEGQTRTATSYQLSVSVQAWDVPLPEPASAPLIVLGSLLAGRRRRR